jgi:hypothetical protein
MVTGGQCILEIIILQKGKDGWIILHVGIHIPHD